MSSIRPSELDDRRNADDELFILDIRPSTDFQRSSIEGSYNIPVYNALRKGDESPLRDELSAIPRDIEIIVVCKMGIVAKHATEVLTTEGYDASPLKGGMSGWSGYNRGSIGYKLRSFFWN